ncbi:hypothetical protein DL95DRAFT_452612 [Leptodontidium sp. 2 PMI_412]|nr:hypothetical protein DL95DRAFT_452612 [Leptodontidium sp. 2 PMI_412]
MAPFRPKQTPVGSYKNPQGVRYSPMHLFPTLNLSRFDFFSPRLKNLKENLKAARDAIHDLDIQAANNQHQLYLEWDLLSDGPEIAKDRHNELAIEHREWHRDLKGMHKQRIHELELEIKKESDYSNWSSWTPIELLLRWKSGNMDYSIFKYPEATAQVHAAFELEAGLKVPDQRTIALVSAQVAAGWYKTPTESLDWISREPEPGYVDEDFPADDSSLRSVYVPGYSLQNTFGLGNNPISNKYFNPLGRTEVRREKRPYIYKPKDEKFEWDEGSGSEMYGEEGGHSVEEFDDEPPSYVAIPKRKRSWAHNYPRQEYSDGELEELAAKANAPEKRKKLVPMIAGRTSSRMILAEEYVD